MRYLRAAFLALGLALGAGCALIRPVRGPTVPHPGQRVWVDEPAVINLVTRYVYEAHFDSRRAAIEERYARLIRYWYTQASSGGKDLDGGQRAVNFIHKIHLDADGSRQGWKQVLGRARQAAPGEDLLPVPAEVE
jgi:hypothetical protein